MKKLIAKFFNLYTEEDLLDAQRIARFERQHYYERLIKHMQINGDLPGGTDMKLPKHKLVLTRVDEPKMGEVVAKEGRWQRIPMDGELLKATYQKE